MPLTLLRHATQKPPIGPLKLDIGQSLSQGLISGIIANDYGSVSTFDAVALASAVFSTSGVTWGSSGAGPVIQTTGSSSSVTLSAAPAVSAAAVANTYTMLVKFANNNSGQHAFIQQLLGPSALDNALIYGYNTNRYETYISSGNNGGRNAIFTGYDALFHTIAIVVDRPNSTIRAYFDSVETLNLNAYTGSTNAGSYNLVLGDAGRNLDNFNGSFTHSYVWNRALAASEITQVTAEPYAMFQTRPMQRWFTVVSAGGATIPPGLGPVEHMDMYTMSAVAAMMR